MHPALSVIFFTVTSGAGYGVLAMLALIRLLGIDLGIHADQIMIIGLAGLGLVTAGLISSTFHLANPKNAWRSFSRFRTSWLSREAVFAIAFYPISLLYIVMEWKLDGTVSSGLNLMAAATLFMALLTIFSTGMIYACLKTIRQWNTALTPTNYIVLGLLLGTLIVTSAVALMTGEVNSVLVSICLGILLLGFILKIIYFFWIGKPAGPTINTALGFTRATVRLLDVGHSAGTFLTDEFGYQVAKLKIQFLRVAVILLAFLLPALILSNVMIDISVAGLIVAAGVSYIGVFVERWLFFAEARHVVNLFHGAQST